MSSRKRRRPSTAEKVRRAQLAKIHIGAKQLFKSKSDYRDMLGSVTGVRSAADLDAAGRRKVIEHLAAAGAQFAPARRSGHKRVQPKASPETEPQISKIRALLAQDGLPDSYAEAILKRMCSHPHHVPLTWAKPAQLRDVIAALEYRRQRILKRAGNQARKG